MTKFETILKLAEIKGAMLAAESIAVPHSMIEELIDDLQDDDDDECPGFGPAYNDSSVDRCHGCGKFHD